MSELPTIFTTNTPHPSQSFWGKYKKIILIVIGIVILGEAAWGIYTLTRPTTENVSTLPFIEQTTSESPAVSAELGLTGPEDVNLNQEIQLQLTLKTDKPADGVDVIIKYDPKKLKVVLPTGKTSPVTTSTGVFAEYPENTDDAQSGLISLSGIISPGSKGYVGSGTLGTLNFQAISSGTTEVSILYDKSSTKDSNIIESNGAGDILNKVTNLRVTIK